MPDIASPAPKCQRGERLPDAVEAGDVADRVRRDDHAPADLDERLGLGQRVEGARLVDVEARVVARGGRVPDVVDLGQGAAGVQRQPPAQGRLGVLGRATAGRAERVRVVDVLLGAALGQVVEQRGHADLVTALDLEAVDREVAHGERGEEVAVVLTRARLHLARCIGGRHLSVEDSSSGVLDRLLVVGQHGQRRPLAPPTHAHGAHVGMLGVGLVAPAVTVVLAGVGVATVDESRVGHDVLGDGVVVDHDVLHVR